MSNKQNEIIFLNPVLNSILLVFVINVGIVIAATVPMIANVIKTSARVKPDLLSIK